MVAKPAIAPVNRPINVGFLSLRVHSIINQVTAATEAAISVLRKAIAVIPFTANSLPAFYPYHPNHNKAVPTATKGTLFG